MILNRLEYALMNNPVRAAVQKHIEARRLLRMGGRMEGGLALEIGCGRGVGVELMRRVFGAARVDALDLDHRMVKLARARLLRRGVSGRVWTADATAIPVASATYDAVFDFGIVHHVPAWRQAVMEIARVLKPGGRVYAEEVLGRFVCNPLVRRLLRHPQADRFDAKEFSSALEAAGLTSVDTVELWGGFAWFVGERSAS